MGMNDVGRPVRQCALGDIGGGAAERGKTQPVVGMISICGVGIGTAVSVKQIGRVKNEILTPSIVQVSDGGADAKEIVKPDQRHRITEFGHDLLVARKQNLHVDAVSRQCGGQGAGDIGETTGLDQRVDFRGDRKDLHS
jgi:hypothetical protein